MCESLLSILPGGFFYFTTWHLHYPSDKSGEYHRSASEKHQKHQTIKASWKQAASQITTRNKTADEGIIQSDASQWQWRAARAIQLNEHPVDKPWASPSGDESEARFTYSRFSFHCPFFQPIFIPLFTNPEICVAHRKPIINDPYRCFAKRLMRRKWVKRAPWCVWH